MHQENGYIFLYAGFDKYLVYYWRYDELSTNRHRLFKFLLMTNGPNTYIQVIAELIDEFSNNLFNIACIHCHL